MTRPPVPAGWRLHLAAGVEVLRAGEVLLGGSPLRALTLSTRGTTLVSFNEHGHLEQPGGSLLTYR